MGPTEIRKSILIVKAQPKSLAAVESFLRNRGWKIHATTDLKEALQVLVQAKPSFVMICVDHPNKKVRALPKLLVQSFPVFVMGFSESNTTLAYKALIDSGAPYRINPPVTGPAIERTINKIIRDQDVEREKQAAAERASKMAKEMMERGEQGKSERAAKEGMLSHPGNLGDDDVTTVGDSDGESLKFPASDQHEDSVHAKDKKGKSTSNDEVLARVANLDDNDADDAASESALLSVLQSAAQAEDHSHGDDGGILFAKGEKRTSQGSSFDETDSSGGSSHQRGPAYMPNQSGGESDGDGSSMADTFIEQDGRNAGTMSEGPAYAGNQGSGQDFGARGHQSSNVGEPLGHDGRTRQGGGLLMPDAQGRKPGEPGYMPTHESDHDDSGGALHANQRNKKHGGAHGDDAEPLNDADDVILEKSKTSHAKKQGHQHNPSDKPLPHYEESEAGEPLVPQKSKGDLTGDAIRKKSKASATYEEGEAESLGSTTKLDPAAAQKKKAEDGKIKIKGSTGWQKNENIVVRGTQKALDDTATIGDGEVKQKLEGGSSNVACLIVESEKFSGYLVAALGKNRKIDAKFIDTVKERLSKFLKENGEPMKDENSMALKIKPVDFEDWALEYADFLRKSVHEGEEIAMAFFPFAEAKTVVETSAQADMGAVKIDELQGDINVDFNLYVYLPANKKYVLYTPRGSKFYGNQKDRLARMGVTHMHVKRTELQDVSKYRAQNYLNSKIQEFEKKKSAKRPA